MAEVGQVSSEGLIEKPLAFRVSPDIQSKYATNMVVQHTDHEFVIHFFEARGPLLLGTPDDIATALKDMDAVPADCVARIIVAAERMPSFVQALQDNLNGYLAQKEGS